MTALWLLGVAGPAQAVEYPSWSDVESARSSEASTQAQVTELTALISGLTTEVDVARAEADRRATDYEAAQSAFDGATLRATNLQSQADEASAAAVVSGEQAGRLAAMLARTGNSDLSLSLFVDGSSASDLLNQLGSMSKLTQRMSLVYDSAAADRNSARSLTDQAQSAQQALGALAETAETALAEAMAASIRVETALADQQAVAATLQAQLAVLTEDRAATEVDYTAGEVIRRAAEAAAAKARAEQVAAAAAAASRPAGGSSSSTPSGQGWTLPVSGWISSAYGARPNKPVAGVGAFHYGTDIAASCGRNVHAASAGTVVYAGWLGSYGNWVLIDHGDGTQTGYAHNSSLLVSTGQQVSTGTTVALVGNTGASSGCHVHFETRVNGARVNPQTFMSDRGVTLG
ncbi:M23 family metallopeptidase [Cryobacterium sp. PH31-L1]|uniref:M23 family metallopeptidase n=1 Tax=Cryobacterium sp. PH31-L1 TaxID=3046199 RepID=UPI0024BB90ED|nr:M23 family metallopeptidase [Cryobacterium sp. PH31-L1]MDJ0379119.1 peptidoglycan DD-metalloendopeptidase family protein [Cryobacterium sp. PH31-L1]